MPPPSVKTSRTRWPGPLGATRETSTVVGGVMVRKRMLKPWANMRVQSGLHVGRDVGVVDPGGGLVRGEVHDDVGPLGGFGDGDDLEAGVTRAGFVGGAGAEADLTWTPESLRLRAWAWPWEP